MAFSLLNKTVLITAGASELGKALAIQLASAGAQVVFIARSQQRAAKVWQEVIEKTGNESVYYFIADLSSQRTIHQLATAINTNFDRLDVLINNISASMMTREETEDGIEYNFAVNHLAPFLLTNLLGRKLLASTPSKIINVVTRFDTAMNFEDLQYAYRPYNRLEAFVESKIGMIHFTYELSRRLTGPGVTVNCVHPGMLKGMLRLPMLNTPEKAAERVMYAITAPELEHVSGKYFGNKSELQSPAQTYDAKANRRLWDISLQLSGLV